MGDMGELYRDLRDSQKEKNRLRAAETPEKLKAAGITWIDKNFGEHFIIMVKKTRIDLWPSTGRWQVTGGKTGRHVDKLIEFIKTL
jgi:hypothetical protein